MSLKDRIKNAVNYACVQSNGIDKRVDRDEFLEEATKEILRHHENEIRELVAEINYVVQKRLPKTFEDTPQTEEQS